MQPATATTPAAAPVPAQRRTQYRVSTEMWARIELPLNLELQLIDLSLSGARLDRELPYPADTRISLVLEPHGADDLPLSAAIVWVANGQTGVEFQSLTDLSAERLRITLMKQQLLNLRRVA